MGTKGCTISIVSGLLLIFGCEPADYGSPGGEDGGDSSESSDADVDSDTDSDTDVDAPGNTINETSFETGEDESIYTMHSWEDDGFTPRWVQGFNQDRAHIDTAQAHTGKSSLRIDYPADAYLSDASGAQVPLGFTPLEEVYVSYWLRFSDNFEWGGDNEGGKLPGLGSGDNCNGGSAVCDGTTGFSARLMWRTEGRVVVYLYHMDKPGQYAEDIPLVIGDEQAQFLRGQWHQITQRVKINSDNNKDGELQMWFDGEEALVRTDLRFVNDGGMVDNLYFSTFRGGNDPSWASPVDGYVWFDDLRIFY